MWHVRNDLVTELQPLVLVADLPSFSSDDNVIGSAGVLLDASITPRPFKKSWEKPLSPQMDVTDLSQVDHASACQFKSLGESGCFGQCWLSSRPRPQLMKQRLQTGWPWFRPILRPDLSDKENLVPDGGNEMMAISIWALQQGLCLIQGQCLRGIQGFVKQFPQSSGGSSWQEDSCKQYWTWSLRRTEFSSIRFKGDENG